MPLFYNMGYCLPGKPFVRCMTPPTEGQNTEYLLLTDEDCDAALAKLPDGSDQYRTVFGFTEPRQDATVLGPLYFDLDDNANPEKALTDTRGLIDLLLKKFHVELLSVAYSGRKGFHVTVDLPRVGIAPGDDWPLIYKYLALSLKPHFATLDLKVYDRARLWRVENTWNGKGERYKIPLTVDEVRLLDLEQIRQLAQQPRQLPVLDDDPVDEEAMSAQANAFLEHAIARYHEDARLGAQSYTAREIRPLPEGAIVPCIARMENAPIPSGERNRTLWVLATHWRRQGLDDMKLSAYLEMINGSLCDPPLPEREVQAVLASVWKNQKSVGCRTPELEAMCPGKTECPYFQRGERAYAAPPTEEMLSDALDVPADDTPTETPDVLSITDTAQGFTATVNGWSLVVANPSVSTRNARARVKMVAPDGYSHMASLDLYSDSSRAAFLRAAPEGQRKQASAVLDLLADYLSSRYAPTPARTATSDDSPWGLDDPPVREENGHYSAKRVSRDGVVSYVPITNFTIRVVRLLHEYDASGEETCVREMVFISESGHPSAPRRARPATLATRPKFVEFCCSCGNFSFSGSENELQHLREAFVMNSMPEDEAWVIDHIGYNTNVEPDLFLFGNAGVHHGELILPNADNTFAVNGRRYVLGSVDIGEREGSRRSMPQACLDYLETPVALQADKRILLDLLKANLYDYRGWLALGMVYAALYMPWLTKRFGSFPGLYLGGPMASGKNTLARWLQNCAGMPHTQTLNFSASTDACLDRWMAYYSGYPVVLDEFRNNERTARRVDYIRNWYDRIGRGTAADRLGIQTKSLPVRGWACIVGQDQANDTAFTSRYVPIIMGSSTRSKDQAQRLRLDELTKTAGCAVSVDLLRAMTPERIENMLSLVEKGQAFYINKLTGTGVERTSYNYAVAVSGWIHAFEDVTDAEERKAFAAWCLDQTTTASEEQTQRGEAFSFLQDIRSMMATNELEEGNHYSFRQNEHINAEDSLDGQEHYASNVWYLWLTGIHPLWSGWKSRMKTGDAFSKPAVMHALSDEPYCLSLNIPKSMRAGGRRCVAIDLDAMCAKYHLSEMEWGQA